MTRSPHPSVRLLHWHAGEAAERGERLAAMGFTVDASPLEGMPDLRAMRQEPPDALVVDLGLASGLVDSKVCRVDETWAALRFSKRKVKQAGGLPSP